MRQIAQGFGRIHWALLLLAVGALLLPAWVWAQGEGAAPSPNPVLSLAIAPGLPDQVLAGTLNSPKPPGIYRSKDGGRQWAVINNGLRENMSVAGLTFDPQNAKLVFAADGGFGYLFRSKNGGDTWEEVPGFKDLLSPTSAVGKIYATIEHTKTLFYAGTRFDGVFRTDNGGDTWQKLSDGLAGEALRIRGFATYSNTLYIGTHNGLYALPAGGNSWTQVAGFPDTGIVFSLVVQASTLYVGTGDSLYRSNDGNTWEKVPNFPVTAINALVNTGRLIVVATDNGLWQGSGDTWQPSMLNGAPYAGAVFALTNTAKAPRTIYAGTQLDWVLRSDDEGVTFHAIGDMPTLDVKAALATATPTATPTHTPTNTPTPTDTATETNTPTPTNTATNTPLPTDTPTPTFTATGTNTVTETPLPTNTPLPTDTPIIAPTAVAAPAIAATVPVTSSGPISIAVALPTVVVGTPGQRPAATSPITNEISSATTPLPMITPVRVMTLSIPVATATLAPPPDSTLAATAVALAATNTPAPTLPPTLTPTATTTPTPTTTPTATATRVPIDVAKVVYASLPPIFVGASVLLVVVIVAAGMSVVRGPRDI